MGFFDNKTVTLFNRSFNAETEEETYYPTLLEGVDLVETKGANVSKSGMDSADAVKLYIDFANLGKTLKPYLPPKAWDVLPEEEKQNYIPSYGGFFYQGRPHRCGTAGRKRV